MSGIQELEQLPVRAEEVSMKALGGELGITYAKRDNRLYLAVTDDGPGFSDRLLRDGGSAGEAGAAGGLKLIAFPVLPVAEAVFLSVGACLPATCIPLRRIGRMCIVEAVESRK